MVISEVRLALPLILLAACLVAMALAHMGASREGLLQALLTFALAWAGLAAYWRKRRDGLRDADTDPATGLLAEPAFTRRLRAEMARLARGRTQSCLALVSLEASRDLGQHHGSGSQALMLQAAGRALLALTRSVDAAGRLSEHRLALLLPDTDLEGGRKAAEKVLQGFGSEKLKLEDGSLLGGIPLNVGVVQLKGRGETLRQALDRAEAALALAQAKGRNQAEAQ
jgi:diguanylate cyclase (GGDEF)-like protein